MHKLVLNGSSRDASQRSNGDLLLADTLESDVGVAAGSTGNFDLAVIASVLRVDESEVNAGIGAEIKESSFDILSKLGWIIVLEVERNHVPEKQKVNFGEKRADEQWIQSGQNGIPRLQKNVTDGLTR